MMVSKLLPLVSALLSFLFIPHVLGQRLFSSSFGVPGNASFDYIVVGGGTAGLTLASRLAENGTLSVAVVEAGSFYEIGNSNNSVVPAYCSRFVGLQKSDVNGLVDWGFFTTIQEGLGNVATHYAAGRTLGGGSARNSLIYQRGTRGAYQQWADTVGDDSYTWDNLLPWFQKVINFSPPSPLRASNATPRYDPDYLNDQGLLSISYAPYAQPFSSWAEKGLAEIGVNPINGFESGYLNGSSYSIKSVDAKEQIRSSSETSYLRKIGLTKSNLLVYQSTLATKILFDNTKKATRVSVDSLGSQYMLSAKREVIVSAGAFQSPHLLMVSGIGPAETLDQFNISVLSNLLAVGQNMWDHVLGGPSYPVALTTYSQLQNASFVAAVTQEYISNRTGFLTATEGDMIGESESTGEPHYNTRIPLPNQCYDTPTLPQSLIEVHIADAGSGWEKVPAHLRANFTANTTTSLEQFPSDWPEVELLMESGYWTDHDGLQPPLSAGNMASVAVAIVAPLSRGNVTISSANMADPPIISPNWLTHPADQQVAIAAFRRAREFFSTEALKPIVTGPEAHPGMDVQSDEEILAAIAKNFHTVYHASCTCAMGKEGDPAAVVDTKGKVFGVSGLRVVDASIMPLLPPGHPQSTIYALAEKIAADILSGN